MGDFFQQIPQWWAQVWPQYSLLILVGGGVLVFGLMLGLIIWGSIFAKAGYSGWRCLLLLIPIVNLIIFLIFAFGEWPIEHEVDRLQQQLAAWEERYQQYQQAQQAQMAQQNWQSGPNYPAVPQGSWQTGPNFPVQQSGPDYPQYSRQQYR